MKDDKHTVIGTFERVDFPDFLQKDVVAKIDTGAYTGALHCREIRAEKTSNGRKLYFKPLQSDEEVVFEHYTRRPVTSSNGKEEIRYTIETFVVIKGKKLPIKLTLANRSGMRAPVLIGRKFLRKNKMIVDARQINK